MNLKDEKMAAVPVRRLMLSMGIPMIVSMVLQAVYNIDRKSTRLNSSHRN